MQFEYGLMELEALKQKDETLKKAIEYFGKIERDVNPDLFSSMIFNIIGQQISTQAQKTIYNRLQEKAGSIEVDSLVKLEVEQFQSLGISGRKAGYIYHFVQQVYSGLFDLEKISKQSDEEAICSLSKLPGVGRWTAEMVLLFSMQRPDILSFNDLGIRKGLCLLYGHETIDKNLFKQYREKFSPYGSIVSFYLWKIAKEGIDGIFS